MRVQILQKNNKYSGNSGFTLIELMVAITIMIVGLVGMFDMLWVATRKNVENELREKAVAVAEQELNNLKAQPFANITSNMGGIVKRVVLSGGAARPVTVQTQVDNLSLNSRRISVRASWNYRGNIYEHHTASAVAN